MRRVAGFPDAVPAGPREPPFMDRGLPGARRGWR